MVVVGNTTGYLNFNVGWQKLPSKKHGNRDRGNREPGTGKRGTQGDFPTASIIFGGHKVLYRQRVHSQFEQQYLPLRWPLESR